MSTRILGSLAAVFTSVGLAAAQAPRPADPAPPAPATPPAAAGDAQLPPSPPAAGGPAVRPWADEPPLGGAPDAPRSRVWGSAEYLLWWIRGYSTPPLIATGPFASQGILGNPGVSVLFDGPVSPGPFSGGRFSAGYWLDDCQTTALQGSFFFLGDRSTHFAATPAPGQILSRPFFNLNQGIEFVETASAPGLSNGTVAVDTNSRLLGGEVNLQCNYCMSCTYSLDLLAGFRYLDLEENLTLSEGSRFNTDLSAFPGFASLAGANFFALDRFATRNQFYGGQVGALGEYRRGRAYVSGSAKVALGATHESIDILGSQLRVNPDGTRSTFTGGLLALNSNIGRHTRDEFAVVPEVGVNVGYYLTPRLSAFVGYTFLYWSNVVRPGDQIDRNLDITRIPNFPVPGVSPLATPHPGVPFKSTDFWAQGINFGVELRW
jgi:hypothetical protein